MVIQSNTEYDLIDYMKKKKINTNKGYLRVLTIHFHDFLHTLVQKIFPALQNTSLFNFFFYFRNNSTFSFSPFKLFF